MGELWICSECGVENELDPDVEESQTISCEECAVEFEVLELDPLEIELLELPETSSVGGAEGADDDGEDDDWD